MKETAPYKKGEGALPPARACECSALGANLCTMRTSISLLVIVSLVCVPLGFLVHAALPPTAGESEVFNKNPEEVGTVQWGRDLDAALTAARQSGKPVFALFQEVPGCAGCKQFGRDVMSHPLIAEAVEGLFVPLLIHNNKGGKDGEVVKRYQEPTFNYQVVRFLDANGQDVIPRKDHIWTTDGIAGRMIATLEKSGRTVPEYLRLLASEKSEGLKTAAFAMACFWTGEAELGAVNGVVSTEAGFISGHEVTLVSYDPAVIAINDLIQAAEKVQCAQVVFLPELDQQALRPLRLKVQMLSGYRKAPASDQKRQIQGTPLTALSLRGIQATKVNAWIRVDQAKALALLSPRQLAAIKSPSRQ